MGSLYHAVKPPVNYFLLLPILIAKAVFLGLKSGLWSTAFNNLCCAIAFLRLVALALVPLGVETLYFPLVLVILTGIYYFPNNLFIIPSPLLSVGGASCP